MRSSAAYFILRRLLQAVPLVLLVSMAAFAFLHLAPGGPAGVMTGNPKVTGEDIARIRDNYGLDRPLALQYLSWFRKVFIEFDLGRSYVTGRPVAEMIVERLPATLELIGASLLLALAGGIALAVPAAAGDGGTAGRAFDLVTTAGLSVPVFWMALMAIWVFSVELGLLPPGGRPAGHEGGLIRHLAHLAMPAGVLAFAWAAAWSRYLRAGLAESLGSGFVRTARAKGLAERTILLKHAMKGAALPAVTVLVMQIPALFTGAVITETVFAWPGMGRLFYEGLQRQDHTRVLGIVIVSSLLIILFNITGDIVCMTLDPRAREGGAGAKDRRAR